MHRTSHHNATCWRRRLVRLVGGGLLLVCAGLTTGCFFDEELSIFVSAQEDGSLLVSISTNGTLDNCSQDTLTTYTCVYFVDGFPRVSEVTLVGSAALLAVLLDPLVVQLPANATSLTGSYSHAGGGGNLVVTPEMTVLIDSGRSLTAEPGTQLVVFDLPSGAPTSGDFAFNINFTLPAGTTSLEMKPLLTGRVEAGGQIFYPPLLPCASGMSGVPAISVPLPAGGTVTLPPAAGCSNVTYSFGPAVPALPWMGLLVALLAIVAVATWQLSRQSQRGWERPRRCS